MSAQEQAKEEPKGLFTSIFDGVKNAGSAVVDGVGKVSRPEMFLCGAEMLTPVLSQVGNMAVDGVKTVGGAVADGAKVCLNVCHL